MNLITATDIWIQHINATSKRNNNTNYEQHQINGLKRGAKTKDAYATITQHLGLTDLTSENVTDSLYDLITRLDSTSLTTHIFEFIVKAINNGSIFATSLTNEQVNTLKTTRDQAQDQYNQILIQDEIITDNSLTSQLVLQDLSRPLTRSSNSQSQSLELTLINAVNTALNIKFADLETKLVTEFGLESNKTKNVSYDKCEFIELKNILKARNIKLLRHKNNISIADEHLNNKTAPKSIHIKHFPRSAFEHNATHVKAYDKILKALQVTLLKLNKETLSQEIIEIEQDIKTIKLFLKRKLENDNDTFDSLVDTLYQEATNETKEDFIKSMQKVTAMKTNNTDVTNSERILLAKLEKPKKSTSTSAPTSLNNSTVSTRSNNNKNKSKHNSNNKNNILQKNKSVSFTPNTQPTNNNVNSKQRPQQNRSNFVRNHSTTTNDSFNHYQRHKPHYNYATFQTNSNYSDNNHIQNGYSQNYNNRNTFTRPLINQHYSPYKATNNANYYSSFPDTNFQRAYQNQSRR